jgi:hypothetical protein
MPALLPSVITKQVPWEIVERLDLGRGAQRVNGGLRSESFA